MEKETRNTLRNTVTQCRRILEEAVGERLEGQYGIHASGKVEAEAHMGHLSPEDADYRGQLSVHVGHIQAGGYTSKEAVAQLVREVAFTHLNRLVAYKMMERRGLIREAVSRGMKSPGFLFYLADHPTDERLWSGGQAETAYRHFLEWLGRTFAEEIRPLFAPHDPANPLFPPPRALDGVLTRLNAPELADIWNEDETIGWVYQYFTPDELRREARAASSAPRNNYELAFLNQFYTPRYVVEFLSDNTLGRIWYEMRQGDTRLTEQCRYLVRRPHELFLAKGEEAPVDSDPMSVGSDPSEIQNPKSEIVPVPYRQKKDPRHLKILDPAGGSGHFLLYCFDLLVTIYEEAYDDAELGPRLQADYPTLADLRRAMPGLILRHNLHLIDIDRRATQIAALALWLRAQRTYQTWQIPADQRPPIRKANIVCAEPMPGDKKLLAEFVAGLNPPLLGQLVEKVFEKMKLAGEAGSLLKIEVELREAIAAAKKEWETTPKAKQLTLFATEPQPEQLGFDLRGISDTEFWDKSEGLVLQALAEYTTQAANGKGLARQLFAEDAVQGFGFIDLTQKQFDIVLMNPPFGVASFASKEYLRKNYATWNNNLLCCFIERAKELCLGRVGGIYDRTAWVKLTYEDFRREVLLKNGSLTTCADLGWEVLDANVEVTTSVTDTSERNSNQEIVFFDLRKIVPDEKEENLLKLVKGCEGETTSTIRELQNMPNAVIGYDMLPFVKKLFANSPSFEESGFQSYTGAQIRAEQHFYLFWERPINEKLGANYRYSHLYNGGDYSRFYIPPRDIVLFGPNGSEVNQNDTTYTWRLRLNSTGSHYYKAGLGFGVRGDYLDAHFIPPGHIFSVEGQLMPIDSEADIWLLLGLVNSAPYQLILNSYCGQHKYSGYVNSLPLPVIEKSERRKVVELVKAQYQLMEEWYSYDHTTLNFKVNRLVAHKRNSIEETAHFISKNIKHQVILLKSLFIDLNQTVATICNITSELELIALKKVETSINESGLPEDHIDPIALTSEFIDYVLGVKFGYFDLRLSDKPSFSNNAPTTLRQYPSFPPGALTTSEGTLKESNIDFSSYPIEIDWDGILVDDPDHPDDIVRRVQQVLAVIWREQAAAIEQEACAILGVKELRDYFRKAGKGGFWDDHVKRYSKSRRKAPIYWLLQSSKGNYALWLYYHRLDKDLYYKALVNYVEPKLRLEENKLSQLLAQRATFGTGGKEAKQLEKDIVRQETFLSELRDFHDKLRAVAHLNLTPDLNDGVILNIAPLRELVPWKEAAKMWDELQAGKYEWSTISKQLLGKGKI